MQQLSRNDYNRENQEPRISLNKLPDFIWGNPVNKESIVYNQKFPSAWGGGRYGEADNAIAKYFASNQNIQVLEDEIQRLKKLQQMVRSPYRPDCILALETFRNLAPLNLKSANIVHVPDRNSRDGIQIEGVHVNMRLDAILELQAQKTILYGAVKLHYSRESHRALSKEKGECIASLLSMFLSNLKSEDREVDPKYCFSVDLFRGTTHTGPKAYKRMMSYVEAGCREYVLMWNACKRKK